jgi:hypothetical protein
MEFLLDTDWVAEYLRGRATVVRAIDGRRGAGLATALVHGLTLCTQNRKHFERIGELKLLSV